MSTGTWQQALVFASDFTESVSLGGGEPTLHPEFFDILKTAMWTFDYVWFATNGSKTKAMYRIADIIDDDDHTEDYCTCDPEDFEDEDYYCECDDYEAIQNPDNKLSVDLSTDYFHDQIDNNIRSLWERRANSHQYSNFSLRDITQSASGVISEGRGCGYKFYCGLCMWFYGN